MAAGLDPACMTADELEDWRDANDAAGPARTARPCDDCPVAWARQQVRQGLCNGHPAGTPRDWPANEQRKKVRASKARRRTGTEHRTARADTRNGRS